MENSIEEELLKSCVCGNYMIDRVFVVMMDFNNGDVLFMVGKKIDLEINKIEDYVIGVFII